MKFPDFLLLLERFLCDTNMSQTELAFLAGVPQSQVSDWVNRNRGSRVATNARRVISFIQEYYEKDTVPIPDNIERAVRKVWQGDAARAEIITKMIESIAPAFD
ncbi:MAG: helix-turn-helix transcriptional regulator [Pseudomonadota bacterium]